MEKAAVLAHQRGAEKASAAMLTHPVVGSPPRSALASASESPFTNPVGAAFANKTVNFPPYTFSDISVATPYQGKRDVTAAGHYAAIACEPAVVHFQGSSSSIFVFG
jgi:hypothetical protein